MSTRRHLRRPGRLGGGAITARPARRRRRSASSSAPPWPRPTRTAAAAASPRRAPAHVANPLAGRLTKVVGTDVSAARYGEEVAAREDFGENLAGEKISDLDPIPARRFEQAGAGIQGLRPRLDRTHDRDAKALGATLAAGGSRADGRARLGEGLGRLHAPRRRLRALRRARRRTRRHRRRRPRRRPRIRASSASAGSNGGSGPAARCAPCPATTTASSPT